jgi:hypothetical protein
VSKLAVFLIRLATDPEVRDRFRNPETRADLLDLFATKKALSAADIKALNESDVSGILGAIAASNQQTDGTAIRVGKTKKSGRAKKKK